LRLSLYAPKGPIGKALSEAGIACVVANPVIPTKIKRELKMFSFFVSINSFFQKIFQKYLEI